MLTILKTGLFLGILLTAFNAQAAELSWPNEPYSHYSNQEPLRDVVESLAASQGIPVVVSDSVDDVVSISFHQIMPAELFDRLIKAYNLTWYYDGNTLFVYGIDEMLTSTIKLSTLTALDFQKSLQDLGIFDGRFPWRVVKRQNLIYFSGPPRFVALVNEMAKKLDINQNQPDNIVYRWIDEYGITHFSSTAPNNVSSAQVDVLTTQSGLITGSPAPDVVQANSQNIE